MRMTRLAAVAAVTAMVLSGCSSDDAATSESADAATTAPEAPSESGEITLLSYNVAGLPAEISTVTPKEHIPLISPLLNDYDIVATQEDFDWWGGFAGSLDFVNYHTRLQAEATHEFRTEAHPGPAAVGLDLSDRMEPLVGDGLSVLSRLPLANTVRVPWTDCFGGLDTSDGGAADCASMKGFLVTEVTLADGGVVHLYNLHAEAGGSARDQELQVANYDQLLAYITDHSAGAAVIVAGDTNLHTNSDHPDASGSADTYIWNAFLAEAGLTDACTATDCPDDEAIDKVAVRSGDGIDLEVVAHAFVPERFRDAAGADLSDHPPLAVTIRWTRTR